VARYNSFIAEFHNAARARALYVVRNFVGEDVFQMARILLADDHPLTRAGLVAWLEKEEDLELVGQATDGENAWSEIQRLLPDVALLDIEMPGMNGIEVARCIRLKRLPVAALMLTAWSAQQYVMASVQAGAKGYILKTAPFEQLRQAIRNAARGIFYLDPSVSLAESLYSSEPLSAREKEVLLLAGQGLPGHAVAKRLSITARTVEAHLTSAYGKLGARNKTEAILLALKRGLVLLDELHIERVEP
jgi:DNA-binding NarL/FixJ family response regulator